MRTIEGYRIQVDWDGETLRARGRGKLGQIALRGQRRKEGDVVLTRPEMRAVEFTDATMAVNGQLKIEAPDATYQLHFRRKQADDFRWLAGELGAL